MPIQFQRRLPIVLSFLLAAAVSYAGDAATFVDLGFSPDGAKFMFAQYGIESAGGAQWAEFYIVDVAKNVFVRDGVRKGSYPPAPAAGQDGEAAMRKLLADNATLVRAQGIDLLKQAEPLYIALDDEGDGESIGFRNFDTGESFEVRIVPYVEGDASAGTLRSSFFLKVRRTKGDGSVVSYTVGTPSVKRKGVASYRVRRVLSAPAGGGMVFVMEMSLPSKSGASLRYMVETLKL